MKNHVIICGLGNLGFQLFEILHRADVPVAVISERTHEEWAWVISEAGGKILLGDARDDNLLLEAGVKEATAILIVTNSDRINLSIAIDAEKLNPKIKIISRIFDTDLGKLLSDSFDIQQMFSTSELAAPVFSINLKREKVLGQYSFNNHNFLVYEDKKSNTDNPAKKTLSHKDNKYLVAKARNKIPHKSSRLLNFIYRYYNLRTPVFVFFRRFIIILFFIILLSSLFLSWAMPLSFTDALYFVIATVSSVGYGDINFLKSSDALKYFGCLLMLTGTAIIAILFSAVTELILLKKLPNLIGGRPIPRKNHVIIVGTNHLGTRIVCSLLDTTPIVIIENDPNNRYPEDISRQVAIVNGNPKSNDTLLRANIKTAKALIAVTTDDIENVGISIAAKKLNPNLIEISQINNIKIGGSLKKALSLTRVYSVPFIAAPYFVAAVFNSKIVFAIEWHDQIVYLWDDNGTLKKEIIPLAKQ